jgi:hypothetical protein
LATSSRIRSASATSYGTGAMVRAGCTPTEPRVVVRRLLR